MTLLTIGRAIADRVGVPQPSTIYGNSDQQTRTILQMLEQEGHDLVNRYGWQVLTKEKTFTSTATEEQSGVIPDDFDRFVDATFWNRTANRQVIGPASAQDWQAMQANRIQAIFDIFRYRGDSLYLLPVPSAGQTYAFEYVSNWWIAESTDETTGTKSAFTDDADVPLLDHELLTLGGVWRYIRSRGLDYAEAFRSYELYLARKIGRDGGAPTLAMSGPAPRYKMPKPTIPDGNWNL